MLRAILATVAALAVGAAPAPAGSYRVGHPPAVCSGDAFADQIGTDGRDRMTAGRRAERLWGLAGSDVLTGSPNRATCLFGGRQSDTLELAGGGGAAFGEHGDDVLTGSPADDLLDGGEGSDVLDGGPGADWLKGAEGLDGFTGGPGDDLVDAADGRAEVVDCGPGTDLVASDRSDLLIECERTSTTGGLLPALRPVPRAAHHDEIVRVRLRVPRTAGAGAYRVVVASAPAGDGCPRAGEELTRLPAPGGRVRRGQSARVGLRPPAGGWCRGSFTAVVTLVRGCRGRTACPAEPIARLGFRAVR